MSPSTRPRESGFAKIMVVLAAALAVTSVAIPAFFLNHATHPSWRDALAAPSAILVYVVGVLMVVLLDRRGLLGWHRAWSLPAASSTTVLLAALTAVVVLPSHPWKAGAYWGLGLGAIQLWSSRRSLRDPD